MCVWTRGDPVFLEEGVAKISNYLSIEVILYSGLLPYWLKMGSYVAKEWRRVGEQVIPNAVREGERAAL